MNIKYILKHIGLALLILGWFNLGITFFIDDLSIRIYILSFGLFILIISLIFQIIGWNEDLWFLRK